MALALLIPTANADRIKWASSYNNDITGGILLDGSSIYITALDSLSKVQASDGKSLWALELKGTLLRPAKSGALIVVVSKEGQLYEVNDATRSILKTVNLTAEVLGDPLVSASSVYIPTEKGIVMFSTQSGTIVWTQKTPCKVHATPVLASGKLFSLCEDGTVQAINTATGEISDQAVFDTIFWKPAPVALENRIFAGSFDGKLYSFSSSSPKNALLLTRTPDGTSVAADLTTDGQSIIFTTAGGQVCSMQTNGPINWCAKTASQVAATPIITDGGIYVITDSGIMYGITHDGNVSWEYPTSLPVKMEMQKRNSMIYVAAKNGTLAALSTSSCELVFPGDGDDISGVDFVDLEINAYADTPISAVQVRANDGVWSDAPQKGEIYAGNIDAKSLPLGENVIYCRVVSQDGEELEPYSSSTVTRSAVGKEMVVNAPTGIGYKSKLTIKVSDSSGTPLDHVSVVFGKQTYSGVNGTLEIVPSERGTYNLEIRRPGYKPYTSTVTVADDYSIIIVMFIFVALLIAVFYIFYKRWMEE